jgi:hypothetical protein
MDERLELLLMLKEEEVASYMEDSLSDFYEEVFRKKGDYIYVIGDTDRCPYCLVAHMDTVRDESKPIDLKKTRNVITNRRGILGADDRAGVYAISKIIERLDALPSILLTHGEESGGLGAIQFVHDRIWSGKDTLFIELDRKGGNEYVTYGYRPNKVLRRYLGSFGYIENHGTFSDIAILTEDLEVPGVNLSVGYYDQHTHRERLHLDELEMTIQRVAAMCREPLRKRYRVHMESRLPWYWPTSSKRLNKITGKRNNSCDSCAQKLHSVGDMVECSYFGWILKEDTQACPL